MEGKLPVKFMFYEVLIYWHSKQFLPEFCILTVKIPQIVKIAGSRSAEGISLLGVILELIAISATWAYSVANAYPFS